MDLPRQQVVIKDQDNTVIFNDRLTVFEAIVDEARNQTSGYIMLGSRKIEMTRPRDEYIWRIRLDADERR